jgi:hypothetical protein
MRERHLDGTVYLMRLKRVRCQHSAPQIPNNLAVKTTDAVFDIAFDTVRVANFSMAGSFRVHSLVCNLIVSLSLSVQPHPASSSSQSDCSTTALNSTVLYNPMARLRSSIQASPCTSTMSMLVAGQSYPLLLLDRLHL